MHAVYIAGDVADQISPKYRHDHPEINWIQLRGLRHMTPHQYGATLAIRVWLAATEGFPEMMGHLEKLLSKKE
jgi:uncharacterized protein with HEPN domain